MKIIIKITIVVLVTLLNVKIVEMTVDYDG